MNAATQPAQITVDLPRVCKTASLTSAAGTYTLGCAAPTAFTVLGADDETVVYVPKLGIHWSSRHGYKPGSRRMGATLLAEIAEQALAACDDLPVGYDTW